MPKNKAKKSTEIERRFLLSSMPPLDSIPYDEYHIVQCWVNGQRYRKIGKLENSHVFSKDYTYMLNSKVKVSAMKNIETTKEISKKTFDKMMEKSEKWIQKIRYKVRDKKTKKLWELDQVRGLFIAEIELKKESEEVKIPKWLSKHVIVEVTGVKELSNFSLAHFTK